MTTTKRNYGLSDILGKVFHSIDLSPEFKASFGEVCLPFYMTIHGESGHGKTSFTFRLARELCRFGKVYYNSFEEGFSKTIQLAVERAGFGDDEKGKFFLGDRDTLEQMILKLDGPDTARFVIIDSLDAINLTDLQFKSLRKRFPRKNFIVICWGAGDKAKSQYARNIEFLADIKCRVHNYKLYPRSRFGGNQPFMIWDRKPKAGDQLKLHTDNQ